MSSVLLTLRGRTPAEAAAAYAALRGVSDYGYIPLGNGCIEWHHPAQPGDARPA